MLNFIKNHKFLIYIFLLSVAGGFFRFYKLDWAEGLFTHPDEYHVVASVNQLSFPTQMHPHFFSYGTVTIYLIYFTQELLNSLSKTLNFQLLPFNSFLIGRFYSALFSTLTIFIVYKICTTFFTKQQFSLITAFLVAITPGLIQQAHFATPESALTFFLLLSLLLIIRFLKLNKTPYLVLASIALGLALGVKISSIVFLLPLVTAIIIKPILFTKKAPKTLLKVIVLTLISTIVITYTLALVAPYVFLDFLAFRDNLEYEGSLALGKIPVFYTRQFIDTTPIIFQVEKILSYALGPSLLLFSGFGIVFLFANLIKKPKIEPLIIILAFLSLFIPSALLFAKWTRFIAPTFPFFAIFAVFLLQALKKFRILFYSLSTILLFTTLLWTITFFSIYTNHGVRTTASMWLESNAKPGSIFLVEGGNTVDLPLRGDFQRTSLDFYTLEDNPVTRAKIIDALYFSDYFLVQSRRVFMNHQRLPYLYPKTARFYDTLFDGRLGFEQIKIFHSYPKLEIVCPSMLVLCRRGNWKLEIPDEGAEETWSVFDHPVIRVFKKSEHLTKEEYAKVFEK